MAWNWKNDMAFVKVLIKFVSPSTTGNVIGGITLNPEILILVGYGHFLTDTMRSRYNHFFHHRKLQTVLANPVQLERYMEPDIETKLTELLEKYAPFQPVIDISDADAQQGLALGTVLRGHKGWRLPILDYRIRDGIFLPQKNADVLRRLPFPSLTAAEMSFLRYGTSFDSKTAELDGSLCIYRKNLERSAIRHIRTLTSLYNERPSYWRDISMRLLDSPIGKSPQKTEFMIDARQLPIRDDIMEELVDEEILTKYVKRSGIVRVVFPSVTAMQLLLHIDRIPVFNLFLIAAYVREYGRTAAYHDLVLRDFTYVTGIHRCLPVVIGLYEEKTEPKDLFRFAYDSRRFFEDPVRMIMVRYTNVEVSEEVRETADLLHIEITDTKQLADFLEPR